MVVFMKSRPRWLPATLGAAMLGTLGTAAAEERDRNRYRLWGGQAMISLPSEVALPREKKKPNLYVAQLRGRSGGRVVVLERGQIPRRYSRVSTARMGAIARDRLKRRGYDIHAFRVAGRTVSIRFGGSEPRTITTPLGSVEIQVPWRAELRWIRQADHQTYQSVLQMPKDDWEEPSYEALERVASSLRVPYKKASYRDRIKDTAASVPLAAQRVGSWFPGWNF